MVKENLLYCVNNSVRAKTQNLIEILDTYVFENILNCFSVGTVSWCYGGLQVLIQSKSSDKPWTYL